jgi:dimethylglycine dehydrogenase
MKRFIKLDKDDFTGKAATLAQKEEDRTLHLVYFEVDASNSDVRGNEPIFSGDEVIGLTTSGGYGHFIGKSLGFGYVPPALSEPGTELRVGLMDERCIARVTSDPAHDPSNERLRA